MNKIELFNFIEENAIFKGIGTFFLVVDKDLHIHFISYNPVEPDRQMCIGDYLKCSNAVASPGGCGCHENCPQCPLRRMATASMDNMTKMEGDISLLLNNNRDYSAHVISTPFENEGQTYSIILMIDRTARQRELMLERIFCHDLLNLSGALNGLLDCADQDNIEETKSVLKSISAQMMEEIKAQRDIILAMNGQLKPEKKRFRAGEIIDFVRQSLVPIAGDMYNVKLRVTSSLGEESIESDKVLINRVIHNMVKNACEDNCSSTVDVRAWLEKGKVIYSVHNDAVMPPQVKSKVFIQGNTTKKGGYGLGTYSMKLIGENCLGGKVHFKSEEGFGTEFYFELETSL